MTGTTTATGPLCPVCVKPSDSREGRCAKCGAALKLNSRYELRRLLGRGGQGQTFAAMDLDKGREVAIKELSLAYVRDWKTVNLFRREAQVLKGLKHQAIPNLIDYFEQERSGVTFFYLVQEFIEGRTLAQELEEGTRFSEEEVVGLALELLEVLDYLHGLSPPVIHRDIKPSNIMRDREGKLHLIDFGLVRDKSLPEGGSTMAVGTAGYAPLEQFAGYALPATDIYGLGATLVALLARKEASELIRPGDARLVFRSHVTISDWLAAILERMLEPDYKARYASAREVGRALKKPAVAPEEPRHEEPREPPQQKRGRMKGQLDLGTRENRELRKQAERERKQGRQKRGGRGGRGKGRDRKIQAPPPKPRRSWAKRGLMMGGLPAVILFLALFITPVCPYVAGVTMGFHKPVMEALNRCAEARELLGGDITVKPLGGGGCGRAQCGSGGGRANWSYPVSGSRGSGTYRFLAIDNSKGWRLVRGLLEIDGRKIDVVQCGKRSEASGGPVWPGGRAR